MRVPLLAVCLLVVFAGSLGDFGGSPTGGTETLTPADRHPGLTPDVDIVGIETAAPVEVTVAELGTRGRGVILDAKIGEGAGLEDAGFRPNGHYQVTVRVDGDVAWNRTVKHFEHYELRIQSNGTVTVVAHDIA